MPPFLGLLGLMAGADEPLNEHGQLDPRRGLGRHRPVDDPQAAGGDDEVGRAEVGVHERVVVHFRVLEPEPAFWAEQPHVRRLRRTQHFQGFAEEIQVRAAWRQVGVRALAVLEAHDEPAGPEPPIAV